MGSSNSSGTLGQDTGICNPKIGSVLSSLFSNSPSRIAAIIALVYLSLIPEPGPYGPPLQPVLISHRFTFDWVLFLLNISAYTVGCKGIKGSPKQAEKDGIGSLTPASVPATFAVYPEIK